MAGWKRGDAEISGVQVSGFGGRMCAKLVAILFVHRWLGVFYDCQ